MTTYVHTFSADNIDEVNIKTAKKLYPHMPFARLLNMIIVEWLEVNGIEPTVRPEPEED